MKKAETIATIALALLIAALILSSIDVYMTDNMSEPTTITCQEDEPCWDCRSMGNRVCGPDNAQGVPAGDYSQ